jgi:hypothetical protein
MALPDESYWPKIIQAVRTPLGLVALLFLVLGSVLTVTAPRFNDTQRLVLLVGVLALFGAGLFVAIRNSASSTRPRTPAAPRPDPARLPESPTAPREPAELRSPVTASHVVRPLGPPEVRNAIQCLRRDLENARERGEQRTAIIRALDAGLSFDSVVSVVIQFGRGTYQESEFADLLKDIHESRQGAQRQGARTNA